MKILLLGSTGVMGTAFERVCHRGHIECVSLSHDNFDITEKNRVEALIDEHGPDVVINGVVFMGINQCEENPDKAFAINATAVMH